MVMLVQAQGEGKGDGLVLNKKPLDEDDEQTLPTPRFKVGESSVVAAARQLGSTMARRVDYSFVDTADVRRRESLEFYAWHQDTQTDRAAVRAEIEVEAKQRLEARIGVFENSALSPPSGRAMIGHELSMYGMGWCFGTEIKANRTSKNGDDNHDSGTGSRRTERAARECNYSDFLKCQPLNFKGIEGVVGLTQWFKRWNLSFISVTAQSRVKGTDVESYSQRFQEFALMCNRMFPEESDEIEKYVGGLPDMIYGSVMASKPKTMQDAIDFVMING
ncbi:hypothetical protein Tco_0755538 [Tanacetum coccineum]